MIARGSASPRATAGSRSLRPRRLSRWSGSAPLTLPNLLIIGAAKSGTTSLAVNLGSHPDVYMAPDELHFFNKDSNWRKGPDWYEAQFDRGAGVPVVGEKTPGYLFDSRVPERVGATLPEARSCTYVVILREPTSRALSDVEHRRRRGVEERDTAVALEQDLLAEPGTLSYDYIRMGFYAEQLHRYIDAFGAARLHVEFYEDLVEDPRSVYRRLFERLGLSDFTPPATEERLNESARIRYPRVFRLLLWLRAGAWLPPSLGRWTWLRLQDPVRYPPLPEHLERALRAEFAPHNAELAELLGRPLPAAWSEERGGLR